MMLIPPTRFDDNTKGLATTGWNTHKDALAGKVPRLLDDLVIVCHPVSQNPQRTLRKISLDDFQSSNVYAHPVLSMSGMKMRRGMIVWVEIDNYPVKATAFRGHPGT